MASNILSDYNVIKAARKVDENAELARVFSDILRAPTHEHGEIFCAGCAKKIGNANGWSDAGARNARSSAGFNHILN